MHRRLPLVLSLALSVATCGGEGGTSPAPVIDAVLVTPASAELTFFGESLQLTAEVTDSDGAVATGAQAEWSSSDPEIASVDATGKVTAVSNGAITITARVEGASADAAVTVDQRVSAVTVTPASDTLDSGSSLQLTAAGTDEGGARVNDVTYSWSSSDEAVATVDADGLVEAVGSGSVTISASADGATGSSELLVRRRQLHVTGDTTLTGGAMQVDSFTVDAGATLTLAADASIDATGPVTLAGDVAGDCVGLDLTTSDSLTVIGSIGIACSTTPPPGVGGLTLTGEGGVRLDGASLVASGDILVRDDRMAELDTVAPTVGARPAATRWMEGRVGASAAVQEGDPTVTIVDSDLKVMPETAAAGGTEGRDASGAPGTSVGAVAEVIFVSGATMTAQHGGKGQDVEVSGDPADAVGGPGGRGGWAVLQARAGGLGPVDLDGTVRLIAGTGGPGGDATATGIPAAAGAKAPNAVAQGGRGGPGGDVFLQGIVSGPFPEYTIGTPGRGGSATATGADGADATEATPAQEGGDATAVAGDAGFPGVRSINGEIRERSGDAAGGSATATAGDGGNGYPVNNRDGGSGGSAAVTHAQLGEGSSTLAGGNGGNGAGACFDPETLVEEVRIQVERDDADSDQYIFDAGTGLVISLEVLLAQPSPGGRGGDGGSMTYDGPDASHPVAVSGAANGGRGGLGDPPGEGGKAGVQNGSGATVTGSFQPGEAGPACAAAPPRSGAVVSLGAVAADGTRTITVDGDAPWVSVTGTLQEDGTFSAEGRGTVAGFSGILVDFEGTFDPTTGELSGLYRMDVEAVISAGHPIVYRVESTGGS